MYSAVQNEALHGFPGHFPANRIKARQQYGPWCVINEHGHARSGFERPNVPALPANDSPFDFVPLKRNRRRGILEGMLPRVALNGYADNTPRLLFRFGFGFLYNMARQVVGILHRLLFDLFEKFDFRLAIAQAGGSFQQVATLLRQIHQFTLLEFKRLRPLSKRSFLFAKVLLGFNDALQLGIDQTFSFAEPSLQLGALRS